MNLIEAHARVQQVETGLKLALLIAGGIAGAISLALLIGAAATDQALKKEQQLEEMQSPST